LAGRRPDRDRPLAAQGAAGRGRRVLRAAARQARAGREDLAALTEETGRMKRVYVIAHTESLHQIQGLGGGWFDTSLTTRGKEQAKTIAERLYAALGVTGIPIYCSDLKRASEVAIILEEVFQGQVFSDRRLREMCFGEAEGKDKNWQLANFTP